MDCGGNRVGEGRAYVTTAAHFVTTLITNPSPHHLHNQLHPTHIVDVTCVFREIQLVAWLSYIFLSSDVLCYFLNTV